MTQPLAEILRPSKLTEFVGQEHLVGKAGIISKLLLAKDYMPSLILWGPSGVGKTTLARIIAKELKKPFFEFSAVNTKTKDIENIIVNNPIVFLDEIHRFNKAQQDKLLPHVEKGNIILIGATTETPSFEVISPLLSRCRVLVLNQLTQEELVEVAQKALKHLRLKVNKEALNFLIESSNGDARILINTLEIAANLTASHILHTTDIEVALQRRYLSFDKNGDNFFDTISAFIKSMRASNVDASLYYLARMVASGQDPLYIARRMVVFASEDVASPTALVVANSVFQACQFVGYPECQENLAAGTVFLATAKKNRSAYEAYMKALEDVKNFGNLPIPLNKNTIPEKLRSKKYFRS
ncbi:hypothetical protein A2130_02215 [Candidatus Woesebacteria bacterium GWC2_33_12]|uniref:Recombination factor protein RarA n=1 Tax=Candidatus Woesebacteria bacterium GW2011_GWB1_33_22 TaxID=1618566 RepID=A0A0F9ZIW3_9BACT|nr:MAG: recombination factor protein RarA [Candidatus Woesebacteria bacterium GW2011_GWC2_33_12]KKP41603.1 MAG: recombination factor protein RarA [Candidatus Woesebacteria bacterium GW2011_GWA2_33_20]KKP44049.1 MAG: recombination factor protein RarA [Candidatus Woesebacteria bacterium GW2011_GWB1_33_22]KKP45710.1 MAG: recombination factor protein RarA [Microgenomates group bacterium GW2011_GWC1_33_28]KKP49572.1 MAG: recombination factor protein RarA [Candidatus Woesebacteria bacterium GW2011_GW